MTAKQYITTEEAYSAHNYHPLDIVINKAHGIWVTDITGKKYMDFLSGYSALNQGHTHKKILAAAKKQMNRLTLTGRAFRNDQFGVFCKELCEMTGYEMFLPMNTGAEAVETAIKVARKWGYLKKGITGEAQIIVCSNNFHGRTVSIVSFSTEEQYKKGFGPFTPGFTVVSYNDVNAIRKAITKNTIGVLLEPIQGEGGIIIPEEGYLTAVANICRDNNLLFILDEIQTGLGRTGKLFAYQHDNVKPGSELYPARPDILIVGKALGGGVYPVSGILSSEEIMEVIRPGDHGSTFGGNTLASAIARESLRVISEENMVENSETMGKYLLARLKTIRSRWIKNIRGKGLMIGIELIPESGGARRFCEALAKEGILSKETHEMVIRLSPPLIITKRQIDLAFQKIKKVLEAKYD